MVRISDSIRTSFNPDGAVLMDVKGGSMLTLNPVGSLIWQQLRDGFSPTQIAEQLVSRFNIPNNQAFADVNEFVQQLEAQQLVRSSESENVSVSIWRPWGLFRKFLGKRTPHAAPDHNLK